MKWEKEEIKEIEETLIALNKIKTLAKDKLSKTKDQLKTLLNEMPEYAELYKKMKGL